MKGRIDASKFVLWAACVVFTGVGGWLGTTVNNASHELARLAVTIEHMVATEERLSDVLDNVLKRVEQNEKALAEGAWMIKDIYDKLGESRDE